MVFNGPLKQATVFQLEGDSNSLKEVLCAHYVFDHQHRLLELHSEQQLIEKHIYTDKKEIIYTAHYGLEKYIERFEKESALASPPAERSGFTPNPPQHFCKEISRNKFGKPVMEIEYYHNRFIYLDSTHFLYDKKKRLTEKASFQSPKEQRYLQKITYFDTDSVESVTTKYRNGEERLIVYAYDKQKRRSEEKHFTGEKLDAHFYYQHTFSGDTSVVVIKNVVTDKQRIANKTLKDQQGRIIWQQLYRTDGSVYEKSTFFYDQYLNEKKVHMINADGTVSKEINYNIDRFGNWTSCILSYPYILVQSSGAREKKIRVEKYSCKMVYSD